MDIFKYNSYTEEVKILFYFIFDVDLKEII